MRNCARLCLWLLCMTSALLAAAQNTNLVFLESSDAKGTLDRRQMAACQAQIIRDMNLAGKELPNILVVHVSEKVGAIAGVNKASLRRNAGKDGEGPAPYYELWLVGNVNPGDYITALETIFEHHFDLKMTEARRLELLNRAARYVKNTVSAYAGGE